MHGITESALQAVNAVVFWECRYTICWELLTTDETSNQVLALTHHPWPWHCLRPDHISSQLMRHLLRFLFFLLFKKACF